MEKRELEEDKKKNRHYLDSSCSKFVPLVSNFKFSFGVYGKIHSTLTRPQRRDASLLRSCDFVAKKNIGSVRFGPGWTGSATSYHKENREPNPRFGSRKYPNLGRTSQNSEVRLTASCADSASLSASKKFARRRLYNIYILCNYHMHIFNN